MLDVSRPKVKENADVYEKMQKEKWSKEIGKQRIKWFVCWMRLDEYTPARDALNVAFTQSKRSIGRTSLGWI